LRSRKPVKRYTCPQANLSNNKITKKDSFLKSFLWFIFMVKKSHTITKTMAKTITKTMAKTITKTRPFFATQILSQQNLQNMLHSNVLKAPYLFNPGRLKFLSVSYYDFDRKIQNDGKIIVLDAVAPMVINIFKKLLQQKFPLQQVKLMDEFKGDDYLAMEANNSSAFNQRLIADTNEVSIHSYGLAIDINPLQNPVITLNYENGAARYFPTQGIKYANRLKNIDCKTESFGFAESVVKIFYNNGFNIWGGNWDNPIDYHHFQTSRKLAGLLITMDKKDAGTFFKWHVKFLRNNFYNNGQELVNALVCDFGYNLAENYISDQKKFMRKASQFIKEAL
jgi:hypothetical protein